MSGELLSCPFCGEEAVHNEWEDPHSHSNCPEILEEFGCNNCKIFAPTEEAWNRRYTMEGVPVHQPTAKAQNATVGTSGV